MIQLPNLFENKNVEIQNPVSQCVNVLCTFYSNSILHKFCMQENRGTLIL